MSGKYRLFSCNYAQMCSFKSLQIAVAKTAFLSQFGGLKRKSTLYIRFPLISCIYSYSGPKATIWIIIGELLPLALCGLAIVPLDIFSF